MPVGIRFGGQAVFEGEEVADRGYAYLTWLREHETIAIAGINKNRDGNIKYKQEWVTRKIKEIMDNRKEILQIMCVHDEKLCDICREECGKVGYFGVIENITPEGFSFPLVAQQGPPFHVNCRCYLEGTGRYGFYVFEGKSVSDEDFEELNGLRAGEVSYIARQERSRTREIAKEKEETQKSIDYYYNCYRLYLPWYEVQCSHGTDPCDGKKGLIPTLEAVGCMPPYANGNCYPEYVGYEVWDIRDVLPL